MLVKGMVGYYLLKPRKSIVGEIVLFALPQEILYERRKYLLEVGTRRLGGHDGRETCFPHNCAGYPFVYGVETSEGSAKLFERLARALVSELLSAEWLASAKPI